MLLRFCQDFAVDCSISGEPAAAVAAFCAMHDWPALSCGVVLELAREGCEVVLADAAATGTGRHWFSATFGLDVMRRFEVNAGDANETYMLVVGPWDNVRLLAETEGRSMGLDASTVDQLTLWIEDQLKDDNNFQFFRRRHLTRLTINAEEAP